ncbi:MAG: hypothetical protein GKR87_01740 [Kiritimatiellae bacterium]|nr:hypothetical protein [Kiritimatiellia bacterium]
MLTTTYQNVKVDLYSSISSGLQITEHGSITNFILELTNVTAVSVGFKKIAEHTPGVALVEHFVDEIALISSAPPATTFNIEPTSVSFTNPLIASPGNYRFITPAITASWFSVDTDWKIKYYTTNLSHRPVIERIGDSSGNGMLWKLTQPNFGGWSVEAITMPPNPNIQSNWTIFYAFIFNPINDGPGEGTDGFKSSFAVQSNSPPEHTTPFFIGVEAFGVPPGSYGGNVFFDFVINP